MFSAYFFPEKKWVILRDDLFDFEFKEKLGF